MLILHLPQIFGVQPKISEVEHQITDASIKYLVLTGMPVLSIALPQATSQNISA